MKYQISRKFWNDPPKFSRNFLGNLIDLKFIDKFGIGSLGLNSCLVSCECPIQKFSENFGEIIY